VLEGSTRVDLSQHKIKMVIIIVLKLDLGLTQGKALITNYEGQPGLTRVNIRIKIIIIVVIIFLKPDSGVDLG